MIFFKLKKINWRFNKELKILINTLNNKSELTIRVVGGNIRNNILGEINKDIDLVANLKPQEIIKKLCKRNIKIKLIGIEYGTIIVIINNKKFTITTLRKDILTFARSKNYVYFINRWEQDTYRRDFTLNTLYSDNYGNTCDLLNYGIKDIKTKYIQFIGYSNRKINEDPLRILRFYRFYKLCKTNNIFKLYNINTKKLSTIFIKTLYYILIFFFLILKSIQIVSKNKQSKFYLHQCKFLYQFSGSKKLKNKKSGIINTIYFKNIKLILIYTLIFWAKDKKLF